MAAPAQHAEVPALAHACAGCAAGVLSMTLTYPLDQLRHRQDCPPGLRLLRPHVGPSGRALRVPVAQRPMPVFWRRLQMQASGAATPRARRRANVRCGVAAGRFGGHAHSGPLARAFFATVVAHEDARAVRSTWAKLNKILQSEGVGELYRGLGSSLLCLAVSNFVYFYWYATPRACVPARGGSTSCTCCIAVFAPRSMQQAVLIHIFHEGKRPAPLPLCLALERGMRHDFSCGCEYAAGTTSSRRD